MKKARTSTFQDSTSILLLFLSFPLLPPSPSFLSPLHTCTASDGPKNTGYWTHSLVYLGRENKVGGADLPRVPSISDVATVVSSTEKRTRAPHRRSQPQRGHNPSHSSLTTGRLLLQHAHMARQYLAGRTPSRRRGLLARRCETTHGSRRCWTWAISIRREEGLGRRRQRSHHSPARHENEQRPERTAVRTL